MQDPILSDFCEPAAEGLAFDEIIQRGLALCDSLPSTDQYSQYRRQIADLSERLAAGRLHLAVLGQFNRGKSTFINALLGMPVLPVSVLPITSIPTIITHGPRISCTVEFSNDNEPVQANESIEEISQILCEYVAEENNPQNRHCVSKVTVTCDSAILSHGTVLIDTPGFGSTHVHNTKTTRRLIEGCDAALFLLSADLPITQVEVEFLQELRRYVPRIFFIYNKADILSEQELEKTTVYVRGILAKSLHVPSDAAFFPISAKMGQEADSHDMDCQLWAESGMERIKTEVVDFMLREKYFALSEALNDKYKSAILHILELLREEHAQRNAPIEKLKTDVQAAQTYAEAFRKEVTQRLEQLAYDEKLLLLRLTQHIAEDKEKLHHKVEQSLDAVLESAASKAGNLHIIQASLQSLFAEVFERLFLKLASAIDKPLQARIATYEKYLEAGLEKICTDLALPADRIAVNFPALSDMHFEAIDSWNPGIALEFPKTSWHHMLRQRLQSRTGRLNSYRNALLPILLEYSDLCLQQLSNAAHNRLRSIFAQIAEALEYQYNELIRGVDQWQQDKQGMFRQKQNDEQPHLAHIESLMKGFEQVRSALS